MSFSYFLAPLVSLQRGRVLCMAVDDRTVESLLENIDGKLDPQQETKLDQLMETDHEVREMYSIIRALREQFERGYSDALRQSIHALLKRLLSGLKPDQGSGPSWHRVLTFDSKLVPFRSVCGRLR